MAARITPYELILQQLEKELFPAIRTEAEARGSDTRRSDQFLLLGHAGAALKEMVPDDAPAEALDEYGDLLYHGYQFWMFGRRLYVLDDALTRHLTEPSMALGDWELAAPPSAYIQFPYQRLWGRISPDAPFEPVDGCFVVVDETAPAPQSGIHLRALLVLGMRPERPGVSLISYRTDIHPAEVEKHAARPWREGEEPFASSIPGGERKQFRTIATTSELEALLLRVLYWLDRESRRLEPRGASVGAGSSQLPYVAVHAP